MPEIVLFSRKGCHLCDCAAAVLSQNGLRFATVDIDENPSWQARYDQCVPVVTVDGKERFRGQVDPVLLRRLLQRGES